MCAKIKALHPNVLERLPNGLYRFMVATPDLREVLFDFLACDRVAAAWAKRKKARSEDLARMERAVERY